MILFFFLFSFFFFGGGGFLGFLLNCVLRVFLLLQVVFLVPVGVFYITRRAWFNSIGGCQSVIGP